MIGNIFFSKSIFFRLKYIELESNVGYSHYQITMGEIPDE
jgi:hypothetical protein